MKWWMNAGLQYTLANIPFGHKVHRLLQKSGGGLANLKGNTRFENAIKICGYANDYHGSLNSARAVELGTGWIPAVPITFLLTGTKVDSYDVQELISDDLFQKTVVILEERLEEIAEASGQSLLEISDRYEILRKCKSLREAMEKFEGNYTITQRTDMLPYKDAEIDIVFSNLVLQCIPEFILPEVVRESYRILKPGGIAIHRIRMTDEYAPCDPNRNELSYLKIPGKTWNRFFNHSLKHVNRWRRPRFMKMFDEIGFQVIRSYSSMTPENIEALMDTGVAKEFQHYSWNDLATVGLHVVLQKPHSPLDRKATHRDDSKKTVKSVVNNS